MEKANKLRALSLLFSLLLLHLHDIVAGSASMFTQSGACNGTDMECAAMAMRTAVEEVVEMELPFDLRIHRRILAGTIDARNTGNANRPACGGSCPARGGSYTRPCTYENQCRSR